MSPIDLLLGSLISVTLASLIWVKRRKKKNAKAKHWNPLLELFTQQTVPAEKTQLPQEDPTATELPFQNCAIIFGTSGAPTTFLIPNIQPFHEQLPAVSRNLIEGIRQATVLLKKEGYPMKILCPPHHSKDHFIKPVLNENFSYKSTHLIQFPVNFLNLN